MREFFRGWRRKVGCVTLVVACVLFVGWARSQMVWEVVCFQRDEMVYAILAIDEGLVGMTWERSELNGAVDVWQTFEVDDFDSIRSELAGIRDLHTLSEWRVAWLPVVISLSLLSTCLLFGKPRPIATPSNEGQVLHA